MPHWYLGLFRPNQVQMAQGPTGRNVSLSLSGPLWSEWPGTSLQIRARATLCGRSGGRKSAAARYLSEILEPFTKELTAPTAVPRQSVLLVSHSRDTTSGGTAQPQGPQEARRLRYYVTPRIIWKWAPISQWAHNSLLAKHMRPLQGQLGCRFRFSLTCLLPLRFLRLNLPAVVLGLTRSQAISLLVKTRDHS